MLVCPGLVQSETPAKIDGLKASKLLVHQMSEKNDKPETDESFWLKAGKVRPHWLRDFGSGAPPTVLSLMQNKCWHFHSFLRSLFDISNKRILPLSLCRAKSIEQWVLGCRIMQRPTTDSLKKERKGVTERRCAVENWNMNELNYKTRSSAFWFQRDWWPFELGHSLIMSDWLNSV